MREEQELLSELYHLEESLKSILVEREMYEEIDFIYNLIKKMEYKITYNIGSWGI